MASKLNISQMSNFLLNYILIKIFTSLELFNKNSAYSDFNSLSTFSNTSSISLSSIYPYKLSNFYKESS